MLIFVTIKRLILHIVLLFILTFESIYAQDIFRFEHYDSKDGLSQNTVSSLLCDRDGFLWIGTMNGLNRFDGYGFKVFDSDSKHNSFINNRVLQLWQDEIGYIWIETYDHYYHFFNPLKETFNTVPDYYDDNYRKINQATCFLQYEKDEIWIGTNARGIYYLKQDYINNVYNKTQIGDKGRFTITNNDVRFILSDVDSTVWVGTRRGINMLSKGEIQKNDFNFHHYFINYSFNSAIELDNEIWFATDQEGIITYNKKRGSYDFINSKNTQLFTSDEVINVFCSPNKVALIAHKNNGLTLYNPQHKTWNKIHLPGRNVEKVYFDKFNNAWITTEIFGVTKLNLSTLQTKTYQLTEQIQKSITDRERHAFYEDSDSNLWVGLHGGALAFYNRLNDTFIKYVNNPSDPYSISSNIVHCITEDRSGQMWLGTGQYKGGLAKVVKRNSAFKNVLPTENITQIIDNVVRCIYQDPHDFIWVSTKNGNIHIYNTNLEKLHTITSLSSNNNSLNNANVYSIFVDQQKHIWLGTKGQGLFVSKKPLNNQINELKNIEFYNYKKNIADSTSLANDNIYSIEKDLYNNIWIGTYGNGICMVDNSNIKELTFKTYNTSNCNLSNNLVRKVKCDSDSNLWIATSFGLNLLPKDSLLNNNFNFRNFYKEAGNANKINYNDVIDIYEDSNKQLWFGTFGGGVSKLKLPINEGDNFVSINTTYGLSNDVIFGILEDDYNRIWLSSEYGLSRYDDNTGSFEVYNESNGLSFNNFSESTSFKLSDGRLIFGGAEGVEVIEPYLIKKTINNNHIKLTNFQLFNKQVEIGGKNSPLKQSISFTDKIKLKHNQSSFSVEYSALDFLDPAKIQYAFILEGFENQWNYVGNQTKATYTNLPHGTYKFKVKHTNRNGQWSDIQKSLLITITPPWWKTKLAYFGYVILMISILLVVRVVMIRVNKYRNDLTLEKNINDLKLRFFTNISHEIRTPLTLILGPLEDILHESNVTKDIRDQLNMMKKNTKRMLQLVNQLLDFRRIQNNKMSLNIQEIDLKEFTQNIFESFIPLAKHNGISFKMEKADNDIQIWADAVKLDSIIYNLISNALKFTPKGKNVSISVDVDTTLQQAYINIEDEGPGIADEQISDIFTRFIILNKNDNRGSGIGLALAYELAQLHGGNIKVSSQPGKGSCFCFSLPLDKNIIIKNENAKIIEKQDINQIKEPEYINEVPVNKLESSTLDKNKSTLLIVEDNTQIASYIKNKLEKDYNCFVAENGIKGLKLAEIHNPDVIVTDIMMPEMDGIEMTKKLKNNFTLCHIPIIIMTAKTDIQDQIEGYETGAEAYITKPLNSRHLKAVVKNLINQRKLIISKYRDNKTIDPQTLKVNTKDEVFLNEMLEFIEKNFEKELSVEFVAEHFCVSRTVLYNKIKGLTGLSPLEFIRQVKLKVSHDLLKKGYSVSETAYRIGYTDVKYFSKQFKLMYGYPPSQIKKSLKS